jgi:hypothetical protein
MTPSKHTAQRDRVAASLAADDARETHRAIYPLRRRETVPGASLAVAVAHVAAERELMRKAGRS